jgi:hypothetical protein
MIPNQLSYWNKNTDRLGSPFIEGPALPQHQKNIIFLKSKANN